MVTTRTGVGRSSSRACGTQPSIIADRLAFENTDRDRTIDSTRRPPAAADSNTSRRDTARHCRANSSTCSTSGPHPIAAAAFGAYLRDPRFGGAVRPYPSGEDDFTFVVHQGHDMGRPSLITVTLRAGLPGVVVAGAAALID